MLQCINYEPSQGHPVVFEIEQREQGEMPDLGSSFRLPFEIATAIVQDELECLWGSLSVTKFVEEIPLKL
jgi:hypothetical protein